MFEKFASAVLLTVGAIGQMVYPGPNCCTFYKDPMYGSPPGLTLCHTGTRVSFNMMVYGWANMISSYECGANTKVDMCKYN